MLLVAFAALFLFAIFIIKNGLPWTNKAVYDKKGGLEYKDALVADLLKRDTDADGVLDWEESLLGLDPTKSETTPGMPDITVANKLRAEEGTGITGTAEAAGATEAELTETDKFSRELFSTVAALEQSGSLDETTAKRIVDSLAESIANPSPAKVYTATEIKVVPSSTSNLQSYSNALNTIFQKYALEYSATDVFEKFIGDDSGAVDESALQDLDPLIEQLQGKTRALLNTSVPQSFAKAHLNFINAMQAVTENLIKIKSYPSDSIVALGAISRYMENTQLLESAAENLARVIQQN